MTELHIDGTGTAHATRRRRVNRVLAVGAFAAGAAVSIAVPAQAAGAAGVTGYHVSGSYGSGVRVVSDPAAGSTVATLADGTSVTIDCGLSIRGRGGWTTVWHHLTAPVNGYVEGYDLDISNYNRLAPGEAICGRPGATAPTATPTRPSATPTAPATAPTTKPTAPATSAPVVTTAPVARGATMSYNEGAGGSCVYYALDRFHQKTGVYPKAVGDARYLATGAAASGWTVGDVPRVDSMVIFQPGQNGAGTPTGHAAWVEQVDGARIYVAEMNAPTAYVVTHRWLTPVAGVKYVYTS
jgi:surface antigen